MLTRRRSLSLIAGTCALPIGLHRGRALDYPTRPVRIVVGFPAGTSSDITARLIGQQLSVQLGQQFVVENRTGAGTNVAAESVVHASPDGYTLLWVTQTNDALRCAQFQFQGRHSAGWQHSSRPR